jgi:hypothetical protein
MGGLVTTLAFPVPPKEWSRDMYLQRQDKVSFETVNRDKIAALHIRGAQGQHRRTLLYSHGNAEDLGQVLPYLDLMSQMCAADVLAYDYCGYGVSEGSPSEATCYDAINAAYKYLTEDQKIDPSQIFAFGRSIGSGPTVDLVHRTPAIRGLVLQSPIESIVKTVHGPSWMLYRLDFFRNYEKVEKITCPVFVMHGTADQVVPCASGKFIHANCVNAVEAFWVPGRGHNDMPETTCLKKIREFLDTVEAGSACGRSSASGHRL